MCQKALHNFRVLLMRTGLMEWVLADLVRLLAEANDIKLTRQQLDSTHITSNIATLTRLGLFVEVGASATACWCMRATSRSRPESSAA